MDRLQSNGRYVVLAFCLILASCQIGSSTSSAGHPAVEFQIDIAGGKAPGTAFKQFKNLEEATALVLSIEDASGAVVYDSEQVNLYGFEGNHLSHPLSLLPGSYALTEFLVIDAAGAVLYAAPVEGSAMAYLVADPLAISFEVSKDAVTTVRPEVLSTAEHVPEDFGYTSFGLGDIEVIDTIDFLVGVFVYNASLQELELTTATIEVVNENGDALYAGSLDAVTNKITVQDGHAQYEVTVSKEGYESKSQSFTAAELAAFFSSSAQGPLEVVLHACAGSCVAAYCGDGIVDATAGEECDAGGNTAICDADCTVPTCGDGFLNPAAGEECDDGNAEPADACTNTCALATCSDGIQNADEIDIDCGGHCGPATCQADQACTVDSDCTTGNCDAGICRSNVVLALGGGNTCALLDAGSVRCWGWNEHGQLGYGHLDSIGDDEPASAAGEVPLDTTAIQIAISESHTCALLGTGVVRCWGDNDYGQLGYGHTNLNVNASAAANVPLGGTAIQLATGLQHTCALLDTGAVRCWGSNGYGQLGYDTTIIGDDEPASAGNEVPLGGVATQISAGEFHTCALLNTGAVRCWGNNGYGQLGYGHSNSIGDDEPASAAGDVPLGGTAIQIDAGEWHTCALLDTGAVRCWGRNAEGQLGYGHTSRIGDDEPASAAGDVPLGGTAIQIATGWIHTCALLDSGAVRCWGSNGVGSLGLGYLRSVGDDEPASDGGDVPLGGTATQVAVGDYHTCALLDSGTIRCWGWNEHGELGYGHTDNMGDDEPASAGGDVPFLP